MGANSKPFLVFFRHHHLPIHLPSLRSFHILLLPKCFYLNYHTRDVRLRGHCKVGARGVQESGSGATAHSIAHGLLCWRHPHLVDRAYGGVAIVGVANREADQKSEQWIRGVSGFVANGKAAAILVPCFCRCSLPHLGNQPLQQPVQISHSRDVASSPLCPAAVPG